MYLSFGVAEQRLKQVFGRLLITEERFKEVQ